MNLYILIQGLGVPLNRSVCDHHLHWTGGGGGVELRQTKTVKIVWPVRTCSVPLVGGRGGGGWRRQKLVSAVRITDALGTCRFNKHGQTAAQVAGPTCQNHDRARHSLEVMHNTN